MFSSCFLNKDFQANAPVACTCDFMARPFWCFRVSHGNAWLSRPRAWIRWWDCFAASCLSLKLKSPDDHFPSSNNKYINIFRVPFLFLLVCSGSVRWGHPLPNRSQEESHLLCAGIPIPSSHLPYRAILARSQHYIFSFGKYNALFCSIYIYLYTLQQRHRIICIKSINFTHQSTMDW